jgi:nitroimidazol reductase NimA-like FMN-containing flavoprotein (pyridoxamine 5'-phosphate oxidase superfamily)/RimJ/RimL family protein N-acetyltransferase
MTSPTFTATERSTPSRYRERTSYERATGYAIIDEAYFCHLGFVVNGEPRILPTLQARIDDTLYLHGSTGSGPLLAARDPDGLAVCVTVTHLDGLVLARSQFHHSANYRSVVAHGRARLVTDEAEKLRALTAVVEKVATGRSTDSRRPTSRELAQTAVLAMPLAEVSVKARVGGANDDESDLALPHWAGVVPLRLTPGLPEPAPGVRVPVPAYLAPTRSPWLTPEPMRGDHVRLEPLDMSHVDGLFAAIGDDDVFEFLPRDTLANVDETAGLIAEALRMRQQGLRVPFVVRSAGTGEILGTTSYYAVDDVNRAVAIGHTMTARRVWRTGVNTESKLLLLRRAFDVLGAVRVEWHTDVLNLRSQNAIARLGAVREGVMRRHRLRANGTWRDTVTFAMTDDEWPAAHRRLVEMLRAPDPGGVARLGSTDGDLRRP